MSKTKKNGKEQGSDPVDNASTESVTPNAENESSNQEKGKDKKTAVRRTSFQRIQDSISDIDAALELRAKECFNAGQYDTLKLIAEFREKISTGKAFKELTDLFDTHAAAEFNGGGE